MDAATYPELKAYLNERMAGKDTPYAKAGLPVAWEVTMPRSTMPKDIQTTLNASAIKKGKLLLGIIQPGTTSLERMTAGPYKDTQPRRGAIRRGTFFLTVMARSLKKYAYDGRILIIEDSLQELLSDFVNHTSHVESLTLKSATLGYIEPDIHALEYEVEVKYVTRSLEDVAIALQEVRVKFDDLYEIVKRYDEVEDVSAP